MYTSARLKVHTRDRLKKEKHRRGLKSLDALINALLDQTGADYVVGYDFKSDRGCHRGDQEHRDHGKRDQAKHRDPKTEPEPIEIEVV